jgi:hypothetical protein
MTYVKLVFAVAIMLAQPVQHDYDHGPVRNGIAVAWSHDVSSIPAERSPEAVAQRNRDPRRKIEARSARSCSERGLT